ncbi:MAG: type II toxin-antitoxin system ParD family antitoxin [Patescibacteria group bacterium]
MTTLSVPVSAKLEEFISQMIGQGRAANKADVVRKALDLLAEEEAIASVLKAEQEIREGKILRGDLRKLMKKLP